MKSIKSEERLKLLKSFEVKLFDLNSNMYNTKSKLYENLKLKATYMHQSKWRCHLVL